MVKMSYFPGCTLKNKAKELDKWARACAEVLGVTLEEIENWQCCGGVYTSAKDEIATKLSSVRNLKSAAEKGQDLITVCSACHNVVKQTNHAVQTDEEFKNKVNRYMGETPYNGETKVYHYLEMLRDLVGFDKIKEKVVNPLKGKKIGAYYGCLLLRPSKVMAMDNPENPTILEEFISAIGAEPVYYAERNECCGGYLALENPNAVKKQSGKVLENAKANGAEMVITACPLCLYNLSKSETDVPALYFTEIFAEALGLKENTNE